MKNSFQISNYKLQIIFVLGIVIGIVQSVSSAAGLYGFIKLLEFVFVGFYMAQNFRKLKLEKILLVFSVGILFESLLAIAQYFNHGSFQGIFYFFGERFFNSQTPGIANASIGGELILRPYGTFPHPNVLGGYLLIAMTIIIFNFQFLIKSKFSILNFRTFLTTLVLAIGTLALFLTMSRIAIILWVTVGSYWLVVQGFRKSKFKSSILYILLSIFALVLLGWIFIASPLYFRFSNISLTDESVVLRQSLIADSIVMFRSSPLFGVGLNNFLLNLPIYEKIQPVHNIFLLILAETGIIGLGFFVWFIVKTFKRIMNHLSLLRFTLLCSILVLSFFDHYFLTLQQGQLLLAFVLGLCWKDPEVRFAARRASSG